MSTRHIVRINPLHSSILLTVMYCVSALILFLIGCGNMPVPVPASPRCTKNTATVNGKR